MTFCQFSPYKSIRDQIWPCRKIGRQPRVIIWTNYDGPNVTYQATRSYEIWLRLAQLFWKWWMDNGPWLYYKLTKWTKNSKNTYRQLEDTYSTVNSFSPTGIQNTNCIALQRRWNSVHSSMFMRPLAGGDPCHTGSSRKDLTFVRMTSNIDRPQHSLSLVSRSPSWAMSICWNEQLYET